jgi:ADP-heptose:LPS heptosyltransferase
MKPRHDRVVFAIDDQDVRRLHAWLVALGIDPSRPYIVVHPGATAPSRRYPAARFGMAADTIAHGSRCTVLFTGDASEESLIAEARAGVRTPSHSLAGQLQLGELGALIAGAQLLVSNNTGPAHIAAAVGTPVVDLYALTNPQHTPWRVASRVLNHDVPCRNCLKSVCPQGHHDCLMRVPPRAVSDAAFELMAERLVGLPPSPAHVLSDAPSSFTASEETR